MWKFLIYDRWYIMYVIHYGSVLVVRETGLTSAEFRNSIARHVYVSLTQCCCFVGAVTDGVFWCVVVPQTEKRLTCG